MTGDGGLITGGCVLSPLAAGIDNFKTGLSVGPGTPFTDLGTGLDTGTDISEAALDTGLNTGSAISDEALDTEPAISETALETGR